MLRLSLQQGGRRVVAGAPRCQKWLAAREQALGLSYKRYFADERKLDETRLPLDTNVKNSSEASSLPENVPKTPPPPPADTKAAPSPSGTAATSIPPTGTGTASVAPSGPPKQKKGRLRRFLLALITLSILGYGGGVWYSLHSDNFHDFFTEYVPFGEDAVGYLEEREFRRRFRVGTNESRLHQQVRGEGKVTIPGRGGVQARVSEEPNRRTSDLGAFGSHMSAKDQPAQDPAHVQRTPTQSSPAEKSKAVDAAKKRKDPSKPSAEASSKEVKPKDGIATPVKENAPAPALASAAPATPIDKLNVASADEPLVQDVVRILNDIIAVVNADNSSGKYSSTITKAKEDLSKVIGSIETLKATQAKAAEDQIRANHIEFDNAAKELIKRLENEMQNQEARWKDEYEAERERLSKAYDNKLQSELESTKQFFDQKLKNDLLEQAIAMRKEFNDSVSNRVETERKGRLGKLDELSAGVKDLEKLTGDWNSVVDSNLKTQHLLVAVESVRNSLENAGIPKPFTIELAALKEVASDDPVVNAAIASINPAAYQRGIPSMSMLIDRFRRVSVEIRKAALLPENAGIASHIASIALSKVMFKKSGLPVGQDVESVLSRAEIWLEEGDLDAAAREVNGLQGWAKVISRDWLNECRKVLEVQQALNVIATEARLQSLLVR